MVRKQSISLRVANFIILPHSKYDSKKLNKVIFSGNMSRKIFQTMKELEEFWENDFNPSDDEYTDDPIDIVELPPETVDAVSDLEDLEEDLLVDTFPKDVQGTIELHGIPKITKDETKPRKKSKKEKCQSKWEKGRASFSISTHGEDECAQRKQNMIHRLEGKTHSI